MKGLELKHIHIHVENKSLFKNFSVNIAQGEVCALMGPSGCGKSTLFNYILGCLNERDFIYSGNILLNSLEITNTPTEKRRIGILFQDPLLFPHLSIEENLAFGIPNQYSRKDKDKKIAKALEQAQLPNFQKKSPDTLSGGQKTRVSLLRTLLAEPEAILLDEPFSKLDQNLRNEFRDHIFTTLGELDIPVMLVTHDPQDIPTNCKNVIQLT